MSTHLQSTRSGWRRLLRFPYPSLILLVILLLGNHLIKLPYSVLSPGQATGVTNFISVSNGETYEHAGDVLFTTVNVRQEAHPFDVFWAWVFPGEELEKRAEIVPEDVSAEEYVQLNQKAMDESKLSAISVAMTRAGYEVTTTGEGAQVQRFSEQSPLRDQMQAGEVIKKVNEVEIATAEELTTALAGFAPGTKLQLVVMGAEERQRTVEVTAAARPNDAAKAFLGVVISTFNVGLKTPFPVEIKTEKVGGPSAGLAFTLALLDQLTPGELTGGRDIATTGTIGLDGTVGEVGGVKQKAAAVNRSDAKVFMVPSGEYDEAVAAVDDDVTVERVDTLQQAIDALARHGGDVSGLPPVPAEAAT